MLRLLLLASLLAAPAHGRCVTADDLATGISFTRQDGHKGHIQTRGGTVQVEYITDRTHWYDSRTTRFGIYETRFTDYLSDAQLVGSQPPVTEWEFSPQPSAPKPCKSWSSRIRQVIIDVGFGTEMKRMVSRRPSDVAARYTFLARGEGTLPGCTYQTLPVEATFTAAGKTFTRRWICFPDLGFGLETKRDGVQNGLTALTPG